MEERASTREVIAEFRQNWSILLASWAGGVIPPVAMITLGLFIAPIEEETGWSRTEITSGPALITIMGLMFSTLAGIAIDKLGYRRIGITAAVLVVVSMVMMSMVTNDLWTWLLAWGVFAFAVAAVPACYSVPVVSYFRTARGLATAMILQGTALAETRAVAPLIAVFVIAQYGWRNGYLTLAAICGVGLPIMYFFLKPPKNHHSQAEDMKSARRARNEKDELPGVTIKQGFLSPAYYKLALAGLFANMVGTTMSINMVPILTLDGISRTAAAAAVGTVGVATLIGKLLGLFIIDRIIPRVLCAVCSIGAMAMPALFLLFPGDLTMALVGITVYGFLLGFDGPAATILFTRHLGTRSYGTLTSTTNAIAGIVIGLAPMAASYLYDTTRSYDLVMWLAFPALASSALLYLSLGRLPSVPIMPMEDIRDTAAPDSSALNATA